MSIKSDGPAQSLGELEQVVLLAALRLDGDGYGLTIQQTIHRATGRDLTIGTIHKTLVRLEAKGLVASRMGAAEPVRGGRAKRHYRVTAVGVKALRASMRAIRRLADGLAVGLEPA
jgi:PadR family transcriptional regulator PadR